MRLGSRREAKAYMLLAGAVGARAEKGMRSCACRASLAVRTDEGDVRGTSLGGQGASSAAQIDSEGVGLVRAKGSSWGRCRKQKPQ